MKKLIIDTNFLLIPFQFSFDIFSEFERIKTEPIQIFVLDKSIDELNKIVREQKGKDKSAAKMALQLVETRADILMTEGEDYVDDLIVSLADKDTIVATQDKELKKRVQKKGAKLIIMKQKKYLSFC